MGSRMTEGNRKHTNASQINDAQINYTFFSLFRSFKMDK